MNPVSKAIGGVALAVCGFAQAAPVPVFTELGVIDNALTALELFRTGEFLDIFNFQVTGGGFAFGAAVGTLGVPNDNYGVNLGAGVLYDAAYNVLAQDLDGSDGLGVVAVLNTAGTYRFAVLGNTLVSGGIYYAGVLPLVQSVPEPGTLLLGLGGLAGLLASRRKQAVAA